MSTSRDECLALLALGVVVEHFNVSALEENKALFEEIEALTIENQDLKSKLERYEFVFGSESYNFLDDFPDEDSVLNVEMEDLLVWPLDSEGEEETSSTGF